MNENTVPYVYQAVVDNSQPLEISREITDKILLKDLFGLESVEGKQAWKYVCSPPDRLKRDGDNAPAYIPASPLIKLEDGSYDTAKIIDWFLYQGLENVIEDSYSRACARSRQRDKVHRSKNFEKFDDETFIAEEALANDKATKEELKEMLSVLIEQSSKGLGMDGKPWPDANKGRAEAFEMLMKLNARIEAKSRD